MPRAVFNLVCSVVFIAIMGGIAYALRSLPIEFAGGLVMGAFLMVLSLYVLNKLGARLF